MSKKPAKCRPPQPELDRAFSMVFSEKAMVILALLIVPIVLAQLFLDLSFQQLLFLSSLEWLIWFAFLLEFTVRLAIARNRVCFLFEDKVRTAIDLVIILSPLVGAFAMLNPEQHGEFFAASLLRLLRATEAARFLRPAAFIARAVYGVFEFIPKKPAAKKKKR